MKIEILALALSEKNNNTIFEVWKIELCQISLVKYRRNKQTNSPPGNTATMMEIDHDQREVFLETMELQVDPPEIHGMQPSAESVAARLTSPVVTTYLDTEKIAFER